VLIELQSIDSVEKKQVFFIPNALSVNSNGEEYFFGSFLDRDLCYRMLTSMVMIAKSLNEITGESSMSMPTEEGVDDVRSGDLLVADGVDDDDDDDDESDGDGRDGIDYHIDKLPNYLKLFETNSISCVYQTSTSLPASMVWRHCWQEKEHFMNFLTSVGDFDILATDWIPFTSTLTSSQDPLRLSYQFKRTVDYMHPRTSMLMFGPKNATAKQIQYLFLPELSLNQNKKSNATPASGSTNEAGSYPLDDISSIKTIRNGCILTATQFEGIPMSDVFEVLQYWSFHKVSSEQTCFSIGVTVNFLKGTLVRGQILAGTKEELAVLSKQWSEYSILALSQIKENKLNTKREKNSGGKISRSNSMMSLRRKSATEDTMNNGPSSSSSSTGRASTAQSNNVQSSSSTGNQSSGDDNRIGRSHLIIYLLLGIILIIQTVFLYLLYRQMTLLGHHVEEMNTLLMKSLPASASPEILDPIPFTPSGNEDSSCLSHDNCLNE
jgi:hypothetical protein